MALHTCAAPSCKTNASGRNIFCASCWSKIPANHRDNVRKGTEKGSNTLRAQPSREWMASALRYVAPGTKVQGANESVTESVTVVG